MGSFAKSVEDNSRKLLMKVNLRCYEIARQLFIQVVSLTPSPSYPGRFATGLLANQWYPDENDFSDELGSDTSSNGDASLSRIKAMRGLIFFRKDGKLTLTNNVSYAYRAEALGWPVADGWSGKTGPYRMVARSIQLIAAKYK